MRAFVERVASEFAFKSIIPAHFSEVEAGPKAWLDAFDAIGSDGPGVFAEADLAFLRTFEATLVAGGTVRPRPRPSKPAALQAS